MKVLIDGVLHHYWFRYDWFRYEPHEGRVKTTCVIENPVTLIRKTGATACSAQDAFVKETGRKLALTRALTTFSRKQRAQFWAAYRSRGV